MQIVFDALSAVPMVGWFLAPITTMFVLLAAYFLLQYIVGEIVIWGSILALWLVLRFDTEQAMQYAEPVSRVATFLRGAVWAIIALICYWIAGLVSMIVYAALTILFVIWHADRMHRRLQDAELADT